MPLIKHLRVLTVAILLAATSHAQVIGVYSENGMSPELARLRLQQSDLARISDVFVRQEDRGMRSASSLVGVPRPFRVLVIEDEGDLIAILGRIREYYGLGDTESLRFERSQQLGELTRYYFREYIKGIRTPQTLRIDVHDELGRIVEFNGALVLDRDFAAAPEMPASAALDCILDHLRDSGGADWVLYDGEHLVEAMFRPWGENSVLTPWWYVSVVGRDRADEDFPYLGFYLIDPAGEILSAAFSSHGGHQELGSCAE